MTTKLSRRLSSGGQKNTREEYDFTVTRNIKSRHGSHRGVSVCTGTSYTRRPVHEESDQQRQCEKSSTYSNMRFEVNCTTMNKIRFFTGILFYFNVPFMSTKPPESHLALVRPWRPRNPEARTGGRRAAWPSITEAPFITRLRNIKSDACRPAWPPRTRIHGLV